MPEYTDSRDSIKNIWGTHPLFSVHSYLVPCWMSSNGCGLDIGVKEGKVVGVRGRTVDRVNKGRLGPKGLNGWVSINHPDSLTQPLIRRKGKLERASWDEAMSLIVKRLLLEEYYVLAMVGKAELNTLHMYSEQGLECSLCTATAAASMPESFGSDGQPGSYADIDYTDCLFLVRHNMAATQTVLWVRVLDRLEGPYPPKLIVVDHRTSDTEKKVTIHHLIIKNGWVNEQYVALHVCGLDELKKVVEKYMSKSVERITGVPVTQLHQTAEALALSGSLLSTALQGINSINLLLGDISKRGSGVLQMNEQPTAQDNRETGCDSKYPGFCNHQTPIHMRNIAKIWNNYEQVPHWNKPTHIMNILSYSESGPIQIFWVSSTNPSVSLRHLYLVPQLFVVVQDLFLTETAAIAEVTDCFTNVDRTMHLSRKAVDPPGEAKVDLDIFLDFARRLDVRNQAGGPLIPFTHPEEEKLSGGSGIWPCTKEYPYGKERLFDDGRFFTDTDYSESYAHYRKQWESPDEEFPFQPPTGRKVFHFHTWTKTGRSKRLPNADLDACVVICLTDADEIGVTTGEMVIVRSRRGQQGPRLHTLSLGYWDSKNQRARAGNELTIEQWDPVSKQSMLKSGALRIEKCVQKEDEPPFRARDRAKLSRESKPTN
ncbi:hypothetical protein BDW67DRAFT_192838 [Aspergillus spinulosporus]